MKINWTIQELQVHHYHKISFCKVFNLTLCSQTRKVEKTTISTCTEINLYSWRSGSALKQNKKEFWKKKIKNHISFSHFNTLFDDKGFKEAIIRCFALHNCTLPTSIYGYFARNILLLHIIDIQNYEIVSKKTVVSM